MTKAQKTVLIAAAAAACVALGAVYFSGRATFSSVSQSQQRTINPTQGTLVYQPLLVATTTSATSTASSVAANQSLRIAGAKKVNVYFDRASDQTSNTGSSRFYVQVTPDGSNWFYWDKFDENASTTPGASSKTLTTAPTTLTGTSTVVKSLDLQNDSFYSLRCIVVEATDGKHSCSASAEF